MNKIFIIIEREFLQRIRKKSFLITTILVPILFGLGMFALVRFSLNPQSHYYIAVFDESQLFNNQIENSESMVFEFIPTEEISKDSLKENYYTLGYDGVLYIPEIDLEQMPNISYNSNSPLPLKSQEFINNELSIQYRKFIISKENVSEDFLDKINKSIVIETIIKGKQDNRTAVIATTIGYIVGFVMYLFLAIYGTIVMRGVMEEKSNKVVEVMISLVKPFQLMIGKIIGIGLVGVTQFFIWLILIWGSSMAIGFLFGGSLAELQNSSDFINANSIGNLDTISQITDSIKEINFMRVGLSLLFYFFFGYIFYASQYAAIGAASTEDTDLQTLALPITLPIIISFVLMMPVVNDPFSKMAVVLSYIPFTSPIIMMSRIAFDTSIWEQLTSMIILLISSLIMVWLGARIYRTGILIQGKKVTFKEIYTWFFYKN